MDSIHVVATLCIALPLAMLVLVLLVWSVLVVAGRADEKRGAR